MREILKAAATDRSARAILTDWGNPRPKPIHVAALSLLLDGYTPDEVRRIVRCRGNSRLTAWLHEWAKRLHGKPLAISEDAAKGGKP